LSEVRAGPKPVQRPWPPIWIGGNSDAALARAVKLGDGLHLIDLDMEEIAPIAARVAESLRAAQRTRAGFTLSLRKGVLMTGDGDADRALYGAADKVRRDRDAYARAGIDYLVVSPRQATSVEQLEAAYEHAAALLG